MQGKCIQYAYILNSGHGFTKMENTVKQFVVVELVLIFSVFRRIMVLKRGSVKIIVLRTCM